MREARELPTRLVLSRRKQRRVWTRREPRTSRQALRAGEATVICVPLCWLVLLPVSCALKRQHHTTGGNEVFVTKKLLISCHVLPEDGSKHDEN